MAWPQEGDKPMCKLMLEIIMQWGISSRQCVNKTIGKNNSQD